MRVGIDARPLGMSATGIGAYIINLVEYLLEQARVECILFADKKLKHEFKTNSRIKFVVFPAKHRVVWEQLLLPGHISSEELDLYHATWNYGLPLRLGCPAVLTIHDVIPLVVPGHFHSLKDKIVYQCIYRMSLELSTRKAGRIIADSQNSKDDIHKLLRVPLLKIEVIPPGLGSLYRHAPEAAHVEKCKSRYGLSDPYIIYTGGLDRRKNIQMLLAAFHRTLSSYGKELFLVLTGEKNFLFPEIRAKVEGLGLEGRVVFTGYVPNEDMPLLLTGASMLAYLSLYEGFGFPPLEAMACGTPVVASNTSSLPEIVGDAGILVDPHSEEDISSAMLRVLEDEKLRRELIAKGLERAQLFKAEDNAKRTLSVYKEVLAQSPQTPL